MKWSKLFIVVLLISLLTGCEKMPQDTYIESTDPFTVQFFFSKTCPHCKQLKENFLPRLVDDFGSQVIIEEYDIDNQTSIDLYDTYIGLYDEENQVWDLEGKLEGVEENLATYDRYIPLVVIGDMYAFMGYTEDLLDAYVQDVHLALQERKLATGDVSHGRWLFKENE